jgi:transposase
MIPWAAPNSRFTMLLERFAIDFLEMTQTVKVAMTILRIKWGSLWHIIERSVPGAKARKERFQLHPYRYW